MQTVVITPVDLCKIRMQLQTASQGSPGYISSVQMLRHVVQREGIFGELPCFAKADCVCVRACVDVCVRARSCVHA